METRYPKSAQLKTGMIIRFNKVPFGSYAQTGQDYMVMKAEDHCRWKGINTGAGTYDRFADIEDSEFTVISQ